MNISVIFILPFFFLASMAPVIALIPLLRHWGIQKGILDLTGERKIHRQNIVRIGGIAFIFSFYFMTAIAFLFHRTVLTKGIPVRSLSVFLAGGALISAVGLYDDFRGLAARRKLLFQVLIVTGVSFFGIHMQFLKMPFSGIVDLGRAAHPATIFWFILIVNSINLLDGIDGLAGSVCLVAALYFVMLCAMGHNLSAAVLYMLLAGGLCGFLVFNRHPASVFMGDSGSYFIGYMMAGLSIVGHEKSRTAVEILIPLMVLCIPIADTAWSVFRRILKKQSIFQADRDHFHHLLLSRGWSQHAIVAAYTCTTVVMGIAALVLYRMG